MQITLTKAELKKIIYAAIEMASVYRHQGVNEISVRHATWENILTTLEESGKIDHGRNTGQPDKK